MKRLPALKKKASKLREQIRVILTDNYRFDESLAARLRQIKNISAIRTKLSAIEREIRELEVA